MLNREVEKKIRDHDTQLEQKATKAELDIERKRIDSFVSLPEGSTQGDAELIDARIGVNSEKYGSVGENIRAIGNASHYLKPKNLANQQGRLSNTGFYNNGTLNTNSPGYTVLDYIEVKEGQHIYGSKNGVAITVDSIVTYNSNKDIVAWKQYFKDMVIPSGVSYVRVMLSESNLEGYQIELDGVTAYEPYFKPYYEKNAKERDFNNLLEKTEEINNCIPMEIGKNLFDVSKIEKDKGFYADGSINNSSGGYCISDFIEVESGRTIYGSVNGVAKTVDRYNKYDANKTLVSSVQYFTKYTVEKNVKYIRVQLQTTLSPTYQIEYDGVTSYEEYKTPYKVLCAKDSDVKLLKNNIDIKNIIIVRQDGNGDYTTLNEALNSIKDNSLTNNYLILIHEGTYDVCSYFTPEQINNAQYTDTGFVGLEVREGIYIEGVGNRDKIIIHGEIATTYSRDKREQISTLNLKGECGLENLTVTSKYIRYPIHDDFGVNKDKKHIIKNCKFIHIANSDNNGQNGAYGLGTNSGSIVECEDCYFEPTFGYHNNANFEKPSVVTLKNCEVTKHISLWDFNTCGVECILNLINTKYCYIFHSFNGSSKTPYIKINGVGNSQSPISCDNSVKYNLDETMKMINTGTTISKGNLVKRVGLNSISKLTSNDTNVYGIALEDISQNSIGRVQYKGYINSNFINISVNVGDYIGVKNGELVVNDGIKIGIVEFEYNNIKFIKLVTN